MTSFREAIVYAWAGSSTENIDGRSPDSSWDHYDTEYCWNADDFSRACGSTNVTYYTVGINVFFLDANQDVPIAIRINHMPFKLFAVCPIDIVILHRSGDKLIDAGSYGIYNTLTGERLSEYPAFDHELLYYQAPHLFYTGYSPNDSRSRIIHNLISYIDLELGVQSGKFTVEKASGEQSIKIFFSPGDDYGSKLSNRIMEPRSFKVNGETFKLINTAHTDLYPRNISTIIDESEKIIIEGCPFHKKIIDAVAFPEDALSGIAEIAK